MKHQYQSVPARRDPAPFDTLAQSLGWFSIGLGLAETLMPGTMSSATGTKSGKSVIRAYGLREIANGIGILSAKDPVPWMWARVAGDALDITTLASRSGGGRAGVALAAVAGITALDIICAQNLRTEQQRPRQPLRDYSMRSGLPRPPEEMRGAALRNATRRETTSREPALVDATPALSAR